VLVPDTFRIGLGSREQLQYCSRDISILERSYPIQENLSNVVTIKGMMVLVGGVAK